MPPPARAAHHGVRGDEGHRARVLQVQPADRAARGVRGLLVCHRADHAGLAPAGAHLMPLTSIHTYIMDRVRHSPVMVVPSRGRARAWRVPRLTHSTVVTVCS
ncbi:unnamed protein product [Danaus chrysippus]|uniref:(African queen) hypothetical protein n=1 Tax=Danaus chrysippus TaxID=151541 RepID=A0A8J2QFS4_9NEOP|nr:unnamed protein product [Danaus chrysippus]